MKKVNLSVNRLIGTLGKMNTCVVSKLDNVPTNRLAVLFPGDIQDSFDMMVQGEYPQYADDWSVEATARKYAALLGPGVEVWLVRSARFMLSEAHYDHLTHPGYSCAHLAALLPKDLPITLYGFSKGGLVLNALLAEALSVRARFEVLCDWESADMAPYLPHHLGAPQRITRSQFKTAQCDASVMNRVTHIHYVDCHRFPTNKPIIELLENAEWPITCHTSKRQVDDPNRPFIRMELDRFLAGVSHIKHIKYFEDEEPSLKMHMKVLFEILK